MRKTILSLALMLTIDFGIADMLIPSLREIPNPENDMYNDSDVIQQFDDLGSFDGLTIFEDR